MKQELPFAIVLLAAGGLLWLVFGSNSQEGPVAAPRVDQNHQAPLKLHLNPDGSGGVISANFQSEVPRQQPVPSQAKPLNPLLEQRQQFQRQPTHRQSLDRTNMAPPNPDGLPVVSLQAALFLHSSSDPKAVQQLVEASRQIADSPPLGSALELVGTFFGQSVAASGRYFQMGQGSHKSRMELRFGETADSPTVFQLCDGRFVYRLQTIGTQQSFEFVDLRRVQKLSGETPTLYSPTGWVATGGISSLFQHLASAFNFGAPEPLDGSRVRLRGSWNQSALQRLLHDPKDKQTQEPVAASAIAWEQIPPQLPHGVEIILAQDRVAGQFPERITFLKFQVTDREHELKADMALNIRFSPTEPIPSMTDRMFVIESSEVESTDTTDQYLARIQDYANQREAAAAKNTRDR